MTQPIATPRQSNSTEILQAIVQPDYWRSLNPTLSISEDAATDLISLADDELEGIIRNVTVEGYFQVDDLLSLRQARQLGSAVANLHGRKCPPVFAFVYDEFWTVCRKLTPVLEHILSAPYYQLPDFWVWYLDPSLQAAGWRPHRDKGFSALLPDGAPKSLTVWISLTDATPMNGCMYVVPAHLDPPSSYLGRKDNLLPPNMQDVRALPVAAGSALGWNQAILHWGGRASQRAPHPRISFACEFQRADVAPYNTPLLDPSETPAFQQRLKLIGKQILQYRHMYGFSESLSEIGEGLSNLPFE